MRNNRILYTDGACSQNGTWEGAWAFVITDENNNILLQDSGYVPPKTTNQRMEIQAILEGLKNIKEGSNITLVSDSAYCCNAVNIWIDSWSFSNTLDTKANSDQWNEFVYLRETDKQNIKAIHIRGHGKDPNQNATYTHFNDICDKLATQEIKNNK